MNDLVRFE